MGGAARRLADERFDIVVQATRLVSRYRKCAAAHARGMAMRVFVVEADGAGGMIHYAHQLCGALSAAGADVTLVTAQDYELSHMPHDFTVQLIMRLWPAISDGRRARRPLGTAVRIARRARRAIRYAWEWERLTRFLLRERPDIVQFAIIRFPFQAFYLRRLARAGLTLSQVCHEFERREAPGIVRRITNPWARSRVPDLQCDLPSRRGEP